MVIKSRLFDMHQNGIPIYLYSLRSGPLEVEITNYGCIITSIRFPDGKGKIEDVILGFDSLKDYSLLTPISVA